MKCKNPYLRTPTGVTTAQFFHEEGRMAATPFGCGQCLHCRINKTRVIQCQNVLESKEYGPHESSIWLLTYADGHLPPNANLSKPDLQKFLKRIRYQWFRHTATNKEPKYDKHGRNKGYNYIGGKRLRYFACGEYGERRGRPHYHIVLYGAGYEIRPLILRAWTKGKVFPGKTGASSEFARYISGYLSKSNYSIDPPGGNHKEFRLQSRKPGLGARYIERIGRELNRHPNIQPEDVATTRVGRSRLPLGRYLSQILRDQYLQGTTISEKNFQDYQFTDLMPLAGKGSVYYDSLLTHYEPDRTKQEFNHQPKPETDNQ